MNGWVERARRLDARSGDRLLALGMALLLAVELATSNALQGPAWVNWTGAAAFPLGMLWRRHYPLQVVILLTLVLGVTNLLDGDLLENAVAPFFSIFLTCFALGVRMSDRDAPWAFGIALAGVTFVNLTLDEVAPEEFVFSTLIVLATPFFAGRAVRGQRERAQALREANLALERDASQAAALAVAGERARIAHELHDVVAHSMSVMVVQAEGARRMMARDPERAGVALDQIVDTGRSALEEMRRLLDVLRAEEDQARTAPQPGLGSMDVLVRRARDAGLVVDVRVLGNERELPPGVDLSAYRIVQEALTNVLQHAGKGVRAIVTIGYGESELELSVVDNGPGSSLDLSNRGTSVGHGIVGMRERVGLYGGDLLVGPGPDGGFEVKARIPIGG